MTLLVSKPFTCEQTSVTISTLAHPLDFYPYRGLHRFGTQARLCCFPDYCADGWWHSSTLDSCFYVSTTTMDQTSAASQCVALGGELVSSPNDAKNTYLASIS